MWIGNPTWQQYWLENAPAHLWTQAGRDAVGVDGVFADNTSTDLPWEGRWRRASHPDQADEPVDYYRDGKYVPDLWRQGLWQFLDRAVPWLAAREQKMVINFGDLGTQRDAWGTLDSRPHPVFAAMSEGAFVNPWGRAGFNFAPEERWLTEVKTLRTLKHVRALLNIHGNVLSEAQNLTRMDA